MFTKKIKSLIGFFVLLSLLTFSPIITLGEDLSSSSFKIEGDGISSGSLSGDSTSFGITGELNPFTSNDATSSSYKADLGYNPVIQANTPDAPTLENPSSYYDRLKLTIDPSNNPSDTLFAIAIIQGSTTYYVQNDNTISTVLGMEDYQTYTSWGGASGFLVTELSPNTGYKAQVKALNGNFTETGFGPESAEVFTSVPSITLALSSTTANFGTLSVASVDSTNDLTLTVSTNATNGYTMRTRGTGDTSNDGLYNSSASAIIPSVDATLSAGTEGYGFQASSGTATVDAKYDLTGNVVGELSLTNQTIATNSGPVINETTTGRFKATISGSTSAGTYNDTVYYSVTASI